MLRPLRILSLVSVILICFALVGCGTIYTRMYSPRKSNYQAPPEKKEASADLLPPVSTPTGDTGPVPGQGAPPPPADGAAPLPDAGMQAIPGIPGL